MNSFDSLVSLVSNDDLIGSQNGKNSSFSSNPRVMNWPPVCLRNPNKMAVADPHPTFPLLAMEVMLARVKGSLILAWALDWAHRGIQ